MDAANCAAVLLSMPISYHFHGCTVLLVVLVVVSGAILNTHLYLYYQLDTVVKLTQLSQSDPTNEQLLHRTTWTHKY